jgi:hypothetical protein
MHVLPDMFVSERAFPATPQTVNQFGFQSHFYCVKGV